MGWSTAGGIKPVTSGAFGEAISLGLSPRVQLDFVYGINGKTTEVFSATGGSVGTDTGMVHCQSGTSVGGYGLLWSKRVLRYRPGQGTRFRWTAMIPTAGIALSSIRAGALAATDELSFGYDGTDYGILHRRRGALEIQTLTLSAGASGAETGTVTLDGTAYPISLTSGTAAHNAFEIAAESFTGWNAYQNGDTVVFAATAVGDKTGSFSYSSDGTSAGSLAETQAGAAVTDTWYTQSEWSITNPSWFDPSKLNVFEIRFQYLGAGQIDFAIENPSSGNFEIVHRIEWANNNTVPNLANPSFRMAWFAASLGSSGTNLEIKGASAAAFVEGEVRPRENPRSFENTKTSIGTSYTNVFTVRNRAEFGSTINHRELIPALLSAAIEASGSNTGSVALIRNATLGGEPNFTYLDQSDSIAEYDTAGTTVTGGDVLVSIPLSKTGSDIIDVLKYDIQLDRTDTLTVAAKASGGTLECSASLTWGED